MRTAPKIKVSLSTVLWLLLPITLSPLSFAHAYLDPGTGSYAIQIAIGVIFGATYSLKSFGGRLLSRFRKPQAPKTKPDA